MLSIFTTHWVIKKEYLRITRPLGIAVAILLLSMAGRVWAQTPISCGETKTGNLTTPDQTDTYTFNGNAGEAVTVTSVGTSGGVGAVATLQNSLGTDLTSNGTGNGFFDFVLPTNDSYTIVISEWGSNNTGTYGVSLQFSTGRCSTSISCGQTIAGNLSSGVQQDAYSFSGNAGEAVTVAAAGPGMIAIVRLYDGAGSFLVSSSGNNSVDFVLPTTGTYTVLVWEFGFNNTGAYGVSLQFSTGQCSTAISCGQTITGNLSIAQQDGYSFSGNAGEAVRVTASGGLIRCDSATVRRLWNAPSEQRHRKCFL